MKNIAIDAFNQGIKKVTIGFSTGKDSLVGIDLLQKANIEFIPIYFYLLPGIQFVENSIKMYEDRFKMKVIMLPHPMIIAHLAHQDWQSFRETKKLLQINWGTDSFKNLTHKYLQSIGKENDFIYDCNCMKMADSINRYTLLKSRNDIDTEHKIIYLTKYFTDKDIFKYLDENKIPLSKDYKIFGRSFDGLAYHYLTGVKKFHPNDYEYLKEHFDLIEAEIMRYELYKKHSNK